MAIFVAIAILMLRYVANATASAPETWQDFVFSNSIALILTIGVPAILVAVLLTSNRMGALKLTPPVVAVLIAVLLPFLLHPTIIWLGVGIEQLYPVNPAMKAATAPVEAMLNSAPLFALMFVIAIVPGIFEELAFRGVILTGLQKDSRPSSAILSLHFSSASRMGYYSSH